MASDTTEESKAVFRSSQAVLADITATAPSGDSKRMRELATELVAAYARETKAAEDERTAAIAARYNPVKDQFVRIIERTDGLLDFIRETGGALAFSFRLPAEGSEQGPEISIGPVIRAAPAAPRAASTNRTGGTGGGRGKVYVVAGQRLSLSAAFEAVATAEDLAQKEKRMADAGTDKSRNSAGWSVMSAVVKRAGEAGQLEIVDA